MVVHHVKVYPVGARINDVGNFFAEPGKVGGKKAGSNFEIAGHGGFRKRWANDVKA
jgi:hypothetical protein